MFLTPAGANQTRLRIGLSKDGEAITDQVMLNKVWVVTQREALIEAGESVPPDLEKEALRAVGALPADEKSTQSESRKDDAIPNR